MIRRCPWLRVQRSCASSSLTIPRRFRHDSSLLTLAIETSCDDTSVALLEKRRNVQHSEPRAILHFHKKVTANNVAYGGIHPVVSLESHQESLAGLVNGAIQHLPEVGNGHTITVGARQGQGQVSKKRRPDFISVTRGPGMRSNLFTGLDTAKGLAVAWQIPLVGVHHMLGHALTPRLASALLPFVPSPSMPESTATDDIFPQAQNDPKFPFLSVLVSGGHTLLIHSRSLTEHKILVSSSDIAIGECLDKIARVVLPPEVLRNASTTMYGALLEQYAFPVGPGQDRIMSVYPNTQSTDPDPARRRTRWGWGFDPPLSKTAGGLHVKSLKLSFSGLVSSVVRVVRFAFDNDTGKASKVERQEEDFSDSERRDIAREAMGAAFKHLADRVVMALERIELDDPEAPRLSTVVMSGGVAANGYLRYILDRTLASHGYSGTRTIYPPVSLCTDNAAMIAWAGMEMFEAGYTDRLSIRAIRKWPMDELLSPPQD